jgi:hypothetical protein
MKTYTVEVHQTIKVTVDESKFDDAFMREFRESFFPFDTIDEHVEHLAQLEARGIADDFIEGYGPAKDMGISLVQVNWETELIGELP